MYRRVKIVLMVDVFSEITIHKPVDVVADYATNPENAPEWYVNIQSAQKKTGEPIDVGSKVSFVAHFLGKKLSYTYEVTELIPGEKLVMQTSEGPFPMETTYTWNAVDNHTTRMTLHNRGNPTGFSKLFAPMMEGMMRKANRKDLQNIKRIMEAK